MFNCVFVFNDLISFNVDVKKVVYFMSFVVVVTVVAYVLFTIFAKAEKTVVMNCAVGI